MWSVRDFSDTIRTSSFPTRTDNGYSHSYGAGPLRAGSCFRDGSRPGCTLAFFFVNSPQKPKKTTRYGYHGNSARHPLRRRKRPHHHPLRRAFWSLPSGVSYNSYLVIGEKIALIDTVEEAFGSRLFENIREVIGERKIDYLVVNHMEPDHSSSIAALRLRYPDLRIVGNAKTLQMIEGYYGIGTGTVEVGEGSTLDLGGKVLSFHLIPMVHWPETMVTWYADEGVVFSGDAFGTFGALDGGITDSQVEPERYWDEMRRYYACIVGKYGVPVQKALQKVGGLPIRTICPTHGPVWQREIPRVVDLYDRLSRYEGEPGAVIAYGSMYGNTEQMAERIAPGAGRGGRAADPGPQPLLRRSVGRAARHLPLRYARRRQPDLQRRAFPRPSSNCCAASRRAASRSATSPSSAPSRGPRPPCAG